MMSMIDNITDQYISSLEGLAPIKTDVHKLLTNTTEYIETMTLFLGSFQSFETTANAKCILLAEKLQTLWILLVSSSNESDKDMILSVISRFCSLKCFAELSIRDKEVITLLVNLFSAGSSAAIKILTKLLSGVDFVEDECILSIICYLNREFIESETVQKIPGSLVSLLTVLYQSIGSRQALQETVALQIIELLDQRDRTNDVPMNRLNLVLILYNDIAIATLSRKNLEGLLHECAIIMETNREFIITRHDSYNLYSSILVKLMKAYNEIASDGTLPLEYSEFLRNTICSVVPIEEAIHNIAIDFTLTDDIQLLVQLWKIDNSLVFDKINEVAGSLTRFYEELLDRRDVLSGDEAAELISFVRDLTVWLGSEAHLEEEDGYFSLNEFSKHYGVDLKVVESIMDLSKELSD